MTPSFVLNEDVQRQLSEALLEDQDLLVSLRRVQPTEDPQHPGLFHCQCTVAVRRPLDPETSELRQLVVTLRRTEDGFEAFELTGLEGLAAQFES
ncbi:MAG: hypothetical protein ACE5EG_09930 [Thermoanaerobaculia bacterium]